MTTIGEYYIILLYFYFIYEPCYFKNMLFNPLSFSLFFCHFRLKNIIVQINLLKEEIQKNIK
jgi:hypothetical protein